MKNSLLLFLTTCWIHTAHATDEWLQVKGKGGSLHHDEKPESNTIDQSNNPTQNAPPKPIAPMDTPAGVYERTVVTTPEGTKVTDSLTKPDGEKVLEVKELNPDGTTRENKTIHLDPQGNEIPLPSSATPQEAAPATSEQTPEAPSTENPTATTEQITQGN